MTNVQYEKPRMKFVDLRNREKIAGNGPCMPQAAQELGKTYYYDIPGDGWVEIVMNKKACDASSFTCTYVDNENIPGEIPDEDQRAAEMLAKAALKEDKQEFSGDLFPVNPDPSWS